jgi:hypothetical protein
MEEYHWVSWPIMLFWLCVLFYLLGDTAEVRMIFLSVGLGFSLLIGAFLPRFTLLPYSNLFARS